MVIRSHRSFEFNRVISQNKIVVIQTRVSLLVLLHNALPQFVQHDRFSPVSCGHVTLFSISQNSQL